MNNVYSFNGSNTTVNADADVRDIVDTMIYGNNKECPRGEIVVLQNIVRNSDGLPVKSPYSYLVSGEASFKNRGSNTTRTGYLCNEKLIRVKKKTYGRIGGALSIMGENSNNRLVFYLSYKDEIRTNDAIILPKLNEDGSILQPVEIETEYDIVMVHKITSDNGRLEYYQAIGEVIK